MTCSCEALRTRCLFAFEFPAQVEARPYPAQPSIDRALSFRMEGDYRQQSSALAETIVAVRPIRAYLLQQ